MKTIRKRSPETRSQKRAHRCNAAPQAQQQAAASVEMDDAARTESERGGGLFLFIPDRPLHRY
jgi:hypothetical protein